jgi:hypothetical protein
MKCTDISSRLVDFLYEELSAAERTEFSAHLASCPTCAAEVKASSRALQRTRTALAGPLNEDPPARVHANILAAARAAAQPARRPRVQEKEGFFARLWKAPWLLPAMGAAGVATAVFLIKVIKNPEVLPVREPASPAMMAKPQPAESEAPAPAAAAAPAEPQAEAEAKQAAPKEEARAVAGKRARAASGAALSRPASPAPVVGARKKAMSDSFFDMDGDVARAPAAPEPAPSRSAAPSPKPAATARPLNGPAWAEPPPPRSLGGIKDHKADVDDLLKKEGASGAGVSQPRGELLQARPQKSAEAARPAPAAPAASAYALPPPPAAAPAKPAPEPTDLRAKAKRAAEAESMAAELADSAPLNSISADKHAGRADKKGSAAKESFDERVRKADKLYNEKKWVEAAIAYSALLAEAPSHPNAPTWRKRFVLAEHAAKSPPKGKAADDALEGIKL